MIYKGQTGDWEVIMGLEMHAQVVSESKLFSRASTAFDAEPNTQVTILDAGYPGALPVLNKRCVEQAVKTGLGLNAKINKMSVFDRKHYFYQDLPLGYQISQFNHPIVGEGVVPITLDDGTKKEIRITRIHLETDAGKSIHDQSPTETFIDLNRAGIALMEIVTEPDFRSSEEVAKFVTKLRSILRYLGTCNGDMEKGSLRCDCNVSVRRVGDSKLGTRAEIKNLNSVKFLGQAIAYEVQRQVALLESGKEVDQETRLFNTATGKTRAMRSKEDAQDYRYFPDPDLLPVIIDDEFIEKIRAELPELPDAKVQRYVGALGLSEYDASIITADKEVALYFENILSVAKSHNIAVEPKLAANWLIGDLFGRLNKDSLSISQSPISSAQLAELLELIQNNTISGKIAKQVFEEMFTTGNTAKDIVKQKGLEQITDESALQKIIEEVLANNQDKVEQYKAGKDKLFGFFVGQAMKATQGKGNPEAVNKILKSLL